jgi:plastocyanin
MRTIALLIATAATAALATPAAAQTRTVQVGDNFFKPGSLMVKRGTTLAFRWVGRAPHTVTVRRGPQKFDSGVKQKGTYRRKVTRKGTYSIICKIHPGQRMTLRVR